MTQAAMTNGCLRIERSSSCAAPPLSSDGSART